MSGAGLAQGRLKEVSLDHWLWIQCWPASNDHNFIIHIIDFHILTFSHTISVLFHLHSLLLFVCFFFFSFKGT